jgi:carotenoid cleavage dioxygenase
MPRSRDPASRSSNDAAVNDGPTITDLTVRGSVPMGLSGRYVCIGEGMVEAVRFDEGRATSHRNRSIPADATTVMAFGASIFAFGDGALAHELSSALETIQGVDLAGSRRSLTADPKFDPITGELHLLTFKSDPSQLHVSVSPGGLTRTIRSIDDAPNTIRQLEVTRDHIVFLADGFVGLTDRTGLTRTTTWFPIDTDARHLAVAHEQGETVVVYATGPSLVRWTLQRQPTTAHSHVLDAAPRTFSTSNSRRAGASHRFLWTVGSGAVHKHDLLAGTRQSHDFGGGRHPGQQVFVADPDRSGIEDGGWLIGFVHDETTHETELVVLDADAIERPAVALARMPRRIPTSSHGTWIPTKQI